MGRSRGLNGEIFVTPATDFPERFLDLDEIYISDHGSWRRLKIESSRMIRGRPVLKIAGFDTPEDVSRLTNCPLAVTPDQLVILPERTFYVFDLIGCEVFDHGSKEKVGEVTDVQRYPANDVYLIRTTDGVTMQLPAVAEFVKLIEIEKKRIEIVPDGLLDERGN